ncbi:hypothetical protein DFH29DRAFT_995339 [Suillus ampliporus]|nr:hypothetical protein DFH29DRAFT_995339 [Suillus ampliporus]
MKKQANELLDMNNGDEDNSGDGIKEASGDVNEDNANDTDGWINEVARLLDEEHGALEESIQPVKLILVKYQAAIDVMMDKRKLGLGEYELSEEEWTLVKQLWDILKVVLKDATLYFSHMTPNLAMDIPAMDHIDAMFTGGIIQKICLILPSGPPFKLLKGHSTGITLILKNLRYIA